MLDKQLADEEEQIKASERASTESALRKRISVLEKKYQDLKEESEKGTKTLTLRRVLGVNVDEAWITPIATEVISELITNMIPCGAITGVLEMCGTLWIKENLIPNILNRFERTDIPLSKVPHTLDQ